jgi:hypothetical protein
MGSGKVLKRAINKYGVKYFIKEILYECETQEEMLQRETDIVNKEFVRRKDTYNINLGGYGGFYCLNDGSKEHIERCTKGGKRGGKTSGKIHAEKLKNDKKYLKEFSEKSSFSMKEKIKNGLINPGLNFKGCKHTDESKAKIGKANSIYQTGEGNSQYGKCWIYSEVEKRSKSIKKEELDQWLEQEWLKGRKMKW